MFKPVALVLLLPMTAMADPADIVSVEATQTGETWRFDVGLLHPDSGWDHYADGWEILDETGARLGYRELAHPHENEQPFIRSLTRINIPQDVKTVTVRSHCSVDGWAEETTSVKLP